MSKDQFGAIQNQVIIDNSLRGVRNTRVYTEVIKNIHAGCLSWNITAQLSFFEKARRSSAIERVVTLREKIDAQHLQVMYTPPLSKKNYKTKKFEDMEIKGEVENGS